MIFNTTWFWPFLFATLIALKATPRAYRPWAALVACLTFHYHYAGPAGMAPVIALGIVVFFIGRDASSKTPVRIVAAIVLCVATLIYSKYLSYFADLAGWDWTQGAIPLGISFFTFEFVHYLVELKRGGKPIRSWRDFSLFAIFFPSLVAGPIKRYPGFIAQFKRPGAFHPTAQTLVLGGTRVLLGAGKKVLLADPLTALCEQLIVDRGKLHGLPLGSAWLLLCALAFRIYLDFSAYSDMAIGTAQMLGLELPENFNWPYSARNLQDFWQRWHISLSSWIRDYIYIPLGGGRVHPKRKVANLFIAFALCGLWHGASGHFIAWGLWHGGGLAVERTLIQHPWGRHFFESRFGTAGTFLFVSLGWLLFFYPVGDAAHIALDLVGLKGVG